MIVLMCISLLVCFIAMKYFIFRSERLFKSFHEIPCPGAIPILGNICDMFYSEAEIWKTTRKRARKYYPIYRLKMFNTNIVCLLHPEDIELILGSTKHTDKSNFYDTFKKLTGNGLLVNKGESWKAKRKLLTKNFHFAFLHNYIEIFNREVLVLVNRLHKQVKQSIDILEPIAKSSLKIINEVIVGEDQKLSDSQINDYVSAIDTISEIAGYKGSRPVINLMYNYSKLKDKEEKALKVLHEYSSGVLENLRLKPPQDDSPRVLDLMVNAPSVYDVQGMKDEIDTFIFGGISTTSAGLSFALLVLANHPKYQDEIYREIVEIVGDQEFPNYANLTYMTFLDRFLKECLRLYPPGPIIGRKINEDIVTKTGYRIPAGTSVIFHIFDIHRNPEVFENPETFDPDRFLPENIKGRHPFSYIPFSAGPRNCIAQKFAVLEIKASICGILKKFKLESVDSIHDVVFVPEVTLKTQTSVKIKFVSRL